jgi:RES domain-containing protein
MCQLEKRVHCNGVAPIDLLLLALELPADAPLQQLAEVDALPGDWIDRQSATRTIGVRWRRAGKALGLWVPSAVEPSEHNLLLNPDHPAYRKIKLKVLIEPFAFDPRMFD